MVHPVECLQLQYKYKYRTLNKKKIIKKKNKKIVCIYENNQY